MKKKSKKNKGITLIALVITIVILLILAGLSISGLIGSGLFGKAQEAVRLTKIREIEEAANLVYMSRQIDEFSKGEAATIAGVISDLKAQGYNIEQRTSGSNTVTGIELNKTNVKIDKDSEETLTYTLVYGEGTVRYFAEIDGKYYEMIFDNGAFKINTKETELEGINKTPKVTAKSNAENIVKAQKTEGKDEIVLKALKELGETTITIKEENSGETIVCNVKVMILIQGITFNQEIINIEKGNNVVLNTLIKINPTDATEEIKATIVNAEGITEEIAKIISDENGQKIVGVKEGTTSIKITNEDGTIEVTCPVRIKISATGISLNKSLIEINKNSIDNTLKATLNPADTTEPVVWSTGDFSKVTVVADTSDPTGKTAKISAVGAGTTTVTATCSGQTASCTVSVIIPATGLTISQTSATVKVGNTLKLTATVTPNNTTDTINWETSDLNVATVSNNGLVTGIKSGTVKINVKCGNKYTTCNVLVGNAIESIVFKSESYELDIGDTIKIDTTVFPTNYTETIRYKSDNENIARVTSSGEVYGVSSGKTKIWAESETGLSKTSCEVTINNKFDVLKYIKNNGISINDVFAVYEGPKGSATSLETLSAGHKNGSGEFLLGFGGTLKKLNFVNGNFNSIKAKLKYTANTSGYYTYYATFNACIQWTIKR
jgi:uncharacterized protein YjdB/type II secretory pathway pseudopilin PulG